MSTALDPFYSVLCVPSQYGLFAECLHWHNATFFFSSSLMTVGEKPLPRCEPSQNGCFWDFPHAHHAYVPGSNSITAGCFAAIVGSGIVSLAFLARISRINHG